MAYTFRIIITSIFLLFAVFSNSHGADELEHTLLTVHSPTEAAGVPTTLNDFFLPGSQPGESGNLEMPDKCDNCHGGYDIAVEPAFNWRGSMMSQAARDPLFYACLAIANQDAPESGDLCIRCHTPGGWLGGRSTPTDGSALTANDREGVMCDFCHRLVTPTPLGVNPYPDDTAYTNNVYSLDQAYLATITEIPPTEANGMYVVDADNTKRGPYIQTVARHQFYYSPLHPEATLCGTCHDVSNPAFTRDSADNYIPNDLDQQAPDFDPYTMFPIERTYSEWLMSAYNTAEGVYAPQFGGNKDTVRTCQDCHMRDVTGEGCNKPDAPTRTDLPFHDMTGGNTFIPLLINDVFPGEANQAALDSGVARATSMLKAAASLELANEDQASSHELTVTVTNETGHKLPSGYPEGRRIWLNVRAYNSSDDLIYESGAYDTSTGVLTHDADAKIYEIKPGISDDLSPVVGYPAGPSFHFVINNEVYSDNRIPPRGFTNANYEAIQSPPVNYTYADGQYWDETDYSIPGSASRVVVTLYYQTTSKEYVEFLHDENQTNDWGDVFYDLWSANGKSAPVVMNIDSLDLTPIAGNQAPILATIGSQSGSEGQLLSFRVSATDPDGTTPHLSATPLPDGAVFTDSLNGAGSFEWTPTYDQSGGYSVTFYAEDDSLAVDSEVVAITIQNVNRPPSLDSVDPQAVAEGDTLLLTVTASDPDGQQVILFAYNTPPNSEFADNGDGSGLFTFTPDYSQAGGYTVTFAASDGTLADSLAVAITVTNTDRRPVLAEIGSQSIQAGDTLSFTVTVTDPDNDSLVLSASPLPSNAAFTDNGDGTAQFDWPTQLADVGDHQVLFIADDLTLADSELVTISVLESNEPPVLDSIGPKNVDENTLLTFTVSASDPNGTTPVLSTSALPEGASFDNHNDGTATFSWTPGFDQAGLYPVVFYASDGEFTDSEQVAITVNDVNRPPVLDAVGDKLVVFGETLSFTLSAHDPDGDSVAIHGSNLPTGASITETGWNAGTSRYEALFEWTPLATDTGTHSDIGIIADDGSLQDDEFISISVSTGTCCGLYTGGYTGNTDCSPDGELTLNDITVLIDNVYLSHRELCCPENGNVDGSTDGEITLNDITKLIDNVYISQSPTAPCL